MPQARHHFLSESRMPTSVKSIFLTALLGITLLAQPALAANSIFTRFELDHGISLEAPSHWKVLSMAERKNIDAGSQAITDNAGLVDHYTLSSST